MHWALRISIVAVATQPCAAPRLLLYYRPVCAGLAQLVVHLICNQGVGGSNPSAGTIKFMVFNIILALQAMRHLDLTAAGRL